MKIPVSQEPLEDPPPGLTGKSFAANIGLAPALWRDLRDRAGDGRLDVLRHCVFIIIKPDCMARKLQLAAWERLSACGAVPLHLDIVLPDPGRWERLYQYNLSTLNPQNMVGAWWLTSRVLAMGPSIAALLVMPPSAGADAHAAISRIKGPSDPYRTKPGELRHDFRATNVAMNLIHSSDDPLLSAHEFLLFAPPTVLHHALDTAYAVLNGSADVERLRADAESWVGETMRLGYTQCDLDPVSTFVALKRRVRLLAPESVRTETAACYAAYDELIAGEDGPAPRWRAFRAILRREENLLPQDGNLVMRVLGLLAAARTWRASTAADMTAALTALTVQYSEWERLVLETTLYYTDLLPDSDGGND
jgi:nucleoside diphosphate kinase